MPLYVEIDNQMIAHPHRARQPCTLPRHVMQLAVFLLAQLAQFIVYNCTIALLRVYTYVRVSLC